MSLKRLRSVLVRIGLTFCAAFCASTALAQSRVTLEKIVDTDSTIPGGTATYGELGRVSASRGNFAWAVKLGSTSGIYARINGVDQIVARIGTPIPEGVGSFANGSFQWTLAKIEGRDVAFRAIGTANQKGIYARFDGGALVRIVDRSMTMPEIGGQFDQIMQPYISNGEIGFTNDIGGPSAGVFLWSQGTLSLIWDWSTPMPPPMIGKITYLAQSVFSNGAFALQAFDENLDQAVITNVGGDLVCAAHAYMDIPGSTGTFVQFLDPTLNGQRITFASYDIYDPNGYYGIYEASDGAVTRVADRNTPIPGGSENFRYFGHNPSHDAHRVVFTAGINDSAEGIYMSANDTLHKLVDVSDVIDRKTPSAFRIMPTALFGIRVAFQVEFTDGSQGLYVAHLGSTVCMEDLNDDEYIDIRDFAILQVNYGMTGADPDQGDLDGDDLVGLSDFAALLAVYGTTCPK